MMLNEKLKSLREGKKLSRRDVIFALEEKGFSITEQTLANWEKGTSQPNYTDAKVLASYYGVSLGELGE